MSSLSAARDTYPSPPENDDFSSDVSERNVSEGEPHCSFWQILILLGVGVVLVGVPLVVVIACCCCVASPHNPQEVVEYMTDSEGFMLHFCQWVAKNPSIQFADGFQNDDHCVLAGGANSHRMEFKNPNSKFVFGGDATTRGDGNKRILRALVDFKARFPERVFLVIGNRDAMLMRLTSEWLDEKAHAAWVTEASKDVSEAFSTTNFELGTSELIMPYQFHGAFPQGKTVAAPWSDKIEADITLKKLAHLHWLNNSQGSLASVRWGKKEQCVLHYADQRGNKPPTSGQVLEVRNNCFFKCAAGDDERAGAAPKRMAEILTSSDDKNHCGGATWQHVLADFEDLVKLPGKSFFDNLQPSASVHEKLEHLRNNYETYRQELGDLAWYMVFANISVRFGSTFIVHADITGDNGPNPEPVKAPAAGAFACIPGLAQDDVYVDDAGQLLVAGADKNSVRKCAYEKEDIGEWLLEIQKWLDKQVYAWMVQPAFSVWPKVNVVGAVAEEARPNVITPKKYELMLAAKQVRDRGGAALIEYGALPSRESTEVPSVIYTRHSVPEKIKSYSSEIHAKLAQQNISTIIHGHTPWGIMPGASYSDTTKNKILVINGDTSYSNASTAPQPPTWLPADARGGAVSWITLQTDSSRVDIRSEVAMVGFRNHSSAPKHVVLDYKWKTLDPAQPETSRIETAKTLPGQILSTNSAEKLQNLPDDDKSAQWHWKTAGTGIVLNTSQDLAVVQTSKSFNFYYELLVLPLVDQ